MATALAKSCVVCTENYSESRRCIKLLCNHEFCSLCIGRIEKTLRKCCPICTLQWDEDLVDSDQVNSLLVETKDQEHFYKKILQQEHTCSEHGLSLKFWCHDCGVLLCRKCVSLKHKKDNWDNIEDCVAAVGKDSNDSCQDIVRRMSEVQNKSSSASFKMTQAASSIEKFVEKLMKVHRQILIDLKKEEDAAAKRNEFTSEVLIIQEKISDMDRTNAANIFNYVQTLIKKAKDLEISTSDKESSLLAKIAMSYLSEVSEGNDEVEAASFVRSLDQVEEADLLLLKDVQPSLASMRNDGEWTVDSKASARAAAMLTAEQKKPQVLKLEFSATQPCMPLSALAQTLTAVKDCHNDNSRKGFAFYLANSIAHRQTENINIVTDGNRRQIWRFAKGRAEVVKVMEVVEENPMSHIMFRKARDVRLYCWDAYYFTTQNGIQKSRERLANFKKHNEGCTLTSFFGHLDSTSLSELPDTVDTLGLAIESPADVATFRALGRWRGLGHLRVSISSALDEGQLSPLPFVSCLRFDIPRLQDERVDVIAQYISALIPRPQNFSGEQSFLKLICEQRSRITLYLPACQLSVSVAERLPQLLKGLAFDVVTFDAVAFDGVCGRWNREEQRSVMSKLNSALRCDVYIWDEPYAYGRHYF